MANAGNTANNSELIDIRTGVDGEEHTSAGIAVRTQVSELVGRLENTVSKKWGNTPFNIIDYPQFSHNPVHYSDGSVTNSRFTTKIYKCPKYLGINIPSGSARLILYIGDMVDGEFVLDENYIFSVTSANPGMRNYLSAGSSRFIETDGTKYFYYSKENSFETQIIGIDEWPESELKLNSFLPYYRSTGNMMSHTSLNMLSIVLPADCYVAYRKVEHQAQYNFYRINYSVYSGDENLVDESFDGFSNTAPFSYIPKKSGAVILTIESNDVFSNDFNLNDIPIYVSTKVKDSCDVAGLRGVKIANDMLSKFKYTNKVAMPWSDSVRNFPQGKVFYGIPYSTGWKRNHFVCFEVTPETALNAANDEYSIWYDRTEGRTEIDTVRNGTGYGLVCSSLATLLQGSPYPQLNFGFTHDKNFSLTVTNKVTPGDIYAKLDEHCVYVCETLENGGYTLFQGFQPCCGKSIHTGEGNYLTLDSRTSKNFLKNYNYSVQTKDRSGYDRNYFDFDVVIANGTVRPWRGNKCVYSNYDKTEGSGIGITLHDNPTTIYLTKPDENVVEIQAEDSTYMDISQYVTEVGTYSLHSNVSEVKEYFRYLNMMM